MVVKSLTGNVEQLLNRLGHGASYSMTQQIETALCIQKLEYFGDFNVALPHNIHPNVFTTLVWDNIDRIEETLSGGGTSHRVNGIVIQPKFIGPELPRKKENLERSKRRSIDFEQENLPVYNAGNRVGPPLMPAIQPAKLYEEFNDAKQKNNLWSLCRQQQDHVPSWTGFNIIQRQSMDITSDEIGYLPTINAPATDIATVYEILQRSNIILKQLQLPYIIVFDQAIYAKAIELTWKHPALFKDLILRMGDFHTVFNFMATIGKRFQDAGLRDLAIEAGVIAEGSAQAVMDGRMYNRTLRFQN